jgi:hypothetical protein
MAETGTQVAAQTEPGTESKDKDKSHTWLDVLKVVLMPLVGLIVGVVFNSSLNARQSQENNLRLYTEMMGKREEADSALRKDMFNSMLSTFMPRDPKLKLPADERLKQDVLSLELLAYNFHESLDLAPLFKDVRRRISSEGASSSANLQERLGKVAAQVVERQLTALADSGTVEKGGASLEGLAEFKAYLSFVGKSSDLVLTPGYQEGESLALLCLSTEPPDISAGAGAPHLRHYRRFRVELTDYQSKWGIQVRLYVSRVLTEAECRSANTDWTTLADQAEKAPTFWVDLFDFPLIDNTRLSNDERCAVALIQLTPPDPKKQDPGSVEVALAYFPGSRASLKEKPYFDEVLHNLVLDRHAKTDQ